MLPLEADNQINQRVHDASDGFHDIKPLPEFSPFPLEPSTIVWLLIVIGLLLALWAFYVRRPPRTHIEPPVDPGTEFFHALQLLRSDFNSDTRRVRETASGLSLAVRRYLERKFETNAAEQTVQEVVSSLPFAIKKSLPFLPKQSVSDFLVVLKKILKSCEHYTFADFPEELTNNIQADISSKIQESENLVHSLEDLVRRERERRTSVIEQGKE